MGEKNEGRDSRALTSVGMRSPVPSKAEFLPQKRSSFRTGATARGEEAARAAPGPRRAPPLSVVLIRGAAAPDVCRSAKISGLPGAFLLFLLGTELVYPHCEHYLRRIGVVLKKKKKIKNHIHQTLATGKVLRYKAVISSSRIWSLPSSPKSAFYLNFSFQEIHKPGFVL